MNLKVIHFRTVCIKTLTEMEQPKKKKIGTIQKGSLPCLFPHYICFRRTSSESSRRGKCLRKTSLQENKHVRKKHVKKNTAFGVWFKN